MIGIVIVSHSHRLAEGVKELADQMAQGRIPIAAAGGLDDSTIGTSFERVAAAVDAAYQPEGVLVLMDLGSAVMTTEMVRDMLPQAQQPHVRLTNAPLVEGAIAAAVAAALGDPLDKVEAAALGALHPSKVADAPAVGGDSVVLPMGDVTDGVEEILTIVNRVGLHARPASQFVQTAGRFNADVRVRNLTRPSAPVDAKSMFGVLGLNARQGDQIAVIASGPEAAAAALALRDLVRAGFGEDTGTDEAAPVASAAAEPAVATAMRPAAGEAMPGIAASPGVALGPAYLHRAEMPRVVRRTVQDRGAEWRRLEDALTKARGALEQLARRTGKQIGKAEAMIFEAQRQFLEDPALIMAVRDKIEREGLNAEAAMFDAASDFAQMLESMEGEIFRQRAADVRDVAARVLRDLGGQSGVEPLAGMTRPAVLVARDLTPSETAQIDPTRVLGICTAAGGATSHTAILARSLGVPAIVGLGDAVLQLADGTPLIVDGARGYLWVEPDAATEARLRGQQAAERRAREQALAVAGQPAITKDGHQVAVWANVGDVATARLAREMGAEGIGLLRTEFLFLDRTEPPTEDEQAATYRAIAEAMGGLPVTVRTLDIGGDKPAPYLEMEPEPNPFLGNRAIRLSLAHPEVFKVQLRAILRVGADYPLRIMFPMIATIDELQRAKALLAEARGELVARGVPVAEAMPVGIMVEVPAAAIAADLLAKEAAFFSLGTNDLTQYTFAADRGNPAVAALGNALHPAILRQVRLVVEAAHAAGHTASVCGEMASDSRAVPLLVGLGIDTLSVNPAAAPDTKAAIRGLSFAEAKELATSRL